MKTNLVLSLLLALSSGCANNDTRRELDLSELGVQFDFVRAGGQPSSDRVSVTVTNPGPRSGTFRLPSPFVAEDTEGFAPFPPYLALQVREPKTGREEGFVLTSLRKPAGPGELVYLKAGQVKNVEYPLMLFYPWGPCSPRAGNFKECFKPGESELEVRAEVFVLEKSGSRKILSSPQTLRCSFPEWLFKASANSAGVPGKPEGNRGGDAKPEREPGKTGDSRP
jgi:hypothetical protein